MELEISDDPFDCSRLEIKNMPVIVTLNKVLDTFHCALFCSYRDIYHTNAYRALIQKVPLGSSNVFTLKVVKLYAMWCVFHHLN